MRNAAIVNVFPHEDVVTISLKRTLSAECLREGMNETRHLSERGEIAGGVPEKGNATEEWQTCRSGFLCSVKKFRDAGIGYRIEEKKILKRRHFKIYFL